jgi:hypothetical protein
MFTALQLQYLCQVQGLEDWTSDYFPLAVTEFWNTDFVPAMANEEYREMQQILTRATLEDIWHLQRALDHLNLLSVSMFELKEDI